METKKLYKSRTDCKIDGVCAGVANYFNADATLVRLIWAAFAIIGGGTGVIAYIVCMFVIPREPDFVDYTNNDYHNNRN